MASSFSSDLKLELMVTGENAGQWGDKTNTNLNLVQQAIAGVETVTLNSGSTLALVMSNAALSNARNMVIKFSTASIAASTVCTIPDSIEKFYIFDATGLTNPENLTIKTASGTGFTLDAAKIYAAYSDGTNLKEVSLDTLGGTVAAAQIADNAVTTAKISNANVTTAKIADNAVTTAKISALQVTQAKIANDAVGSDQLANTPVSAGSYTLASITVDAQGRLTAASSGSTPSPITEFFFIEGQGDTGILQNHGTAIGSGATLHIFAQGGAGGGGGNQGHNQGPIVGGGRGSAGQICYFTTTLSGAYTAQPYSLGENGGAGNSGPNPGQAGNATTFTNFVTAPGGNAGPGGNRGPNSGGGGPNTGQSLPTVNNSATINFAPFAPVNPGNANTGTFAPNLGSDGTLTNNLVLTANQKIIGQCTAAVFGLPPGARSLGQNQGGNGAPPGPAAGQAGSGNAFLGIIVE